MKGTEKQIKWAEDIKRNLVRVYEAIKQADAANAAYGDAAIAKLEAIDEASTIIDLYKRVSFNGDLQHDFTALAACHRTMTAAERAKVMP